MIVKNCRFLFATGFALLWCGIEPRAFSAVVRHTLRPDDSVFSVQTQHACGTYLLQPSPHWCNPALFSFANEAAIKSDTALSADQDAYDLTSKFLNEPIDRAFIDELFKEQDFQSFSGLVRLEAMSTYLSFAYTPGYVVGAYKLSNPNLPEISAAGMKASEFRITSGMKLIDAGDWELYGGAGLNLYERKVYYINANALELIVRDVDALVETNHEQGINGQLGFYAHNPDALWPTFSLTAENIFTAQDPALGATRPLALEPIYRRIARLGTGYSFIHSTGSYSLGLQLPYWDAFREMDRQGASMALIYGIGRLRTFASYSQLMSAFGFLFMSSHYHVGIQYTSDKQDNSLELKRRKNVYLFVSFNF